MSHFRPKEVLHRAQKSEKEGQVKEAAKGYALLSVYLRKKSKFADAGKMISRAINLNPESGRLYLEEAACFLGLKEEKRALESIQKCVQVGLEKKQLHVYLGHLRKHLNSSPWLHQKFFELWLSIDRTSPTPFFGLGQEFLEQGQWQEARELFLKGLRIEPENEELIASLRNILEKHGSEAEREYFKRFIEKELNYDNFILLIKKAPETKSQIKPPRPKTEERSELKGLSELISDLEKELELNAENEHENIEPVIQEFVRKSHQVIGSDLQARLDLAFAFFEMGRLREAKAELNQIGPEHLLFGQAQYLLGTIQLQEGSDVAALGAFQAALRTAFKATSFWKETTYQLIKLNAKLGDFVSAQRLILQLEKCEPDYRDLKNLKRAIKKEPV